ncbi:MAG: hypothetical protein JXR76_09440 [Deltaproteobacteria bacterium]|nr:hypothetical protein [Deltaproteobacteria bacterium]
MKKVSKRIFHEGLQRVAASKHRIAKAFSGDIERQNQYMGDSRFRGTYLMLIQEEPLAAARHLEKRLSDYAAKTKDHSVNDDVRKLLMDREQHLTAQCRTDDKQAEQKSATNN